MSVIVGAPLRPGSEQLLEFAALVAKSLGQPLTLLHVTEAATDELVLSGDAALAPPDTVARLEACAAGLRQLAGVLVVCRLAAGSPAHALVTLARLEQARLVIVGPTTRHLRNTAERVARESTAPVLVPHASMPLIAWLRGHRTLRWLVGTDLGESSDAAVAFALMCAGFGPSEVTVAMVADPTTTHERLGLPSQSDGLSSDAEAALRLRMTKAAPPAAPATFRVIAGSGPPAEHLLDLATREAFDVIVVGQRPRSFLQRVWKGSVARKVLAAGIATVANVPVRSDDMARALPRPQVILVGVDLAGDDLRAILHAASIIGAGGAIHVVHVADTRTNPGDGAAVDPRAALDTLTLAMERLCARATRLEPRVTITSHIIFGEPTAALKAIAARTAADVVVFGASRRSSVDRLVFGSISRAFVEGGDVPVLVVPERAR